MKTAFPLLTAHPEFGGWMRDIAHALLVCMLAGFICSIVAQALLWPRRTPAEHIIVMEAVSYVSLLVGLEDLRLRRLLRRRDR